MIYVARAFARKFPAKNRKQPFPQTLVALVIAGDLPGFTGEALHNLRVVDMGDGTITLLVEDSEVQPRLEGWEISDIIEAGMSGPLRGHPGAGTGETDDG